MAKSEVPPLQSIIESVLSEWGGAAQFARAFRDTYDKAKPGTVTRQRLLEKMLDFMRMYQEMYGEADDVDGLSEEELASLVKELNDEQGEGGRRKAAKAAGDGGAGQPAGGDSTPGPAAST